MVRLGAGGEAAVGRSDLRIEEKKKEKGSTSEMKVGNTHKSDADGNLIHDYKREKEGVVYGEGNVNGNQEGVGRMWKIKFSTSSSQSMTGNRYQYPSVKNFGEVEYRKGGGELNETVDRSKVGSGTEQVKSLWEVLAKLAGEIRNGQVFDVLETAKSRGMKLTRPRWWGDMGGNDWLEK